jgi:hypothetical protein
LHDGNIVARRSIGLVDFACAPHHRRSIYARSLERSLGRVKRT